MRAVVETLNGYGFSVQRGEVPDLDPESGQPVMNGDGPRMVPLTVISWSDPETRHRVDIPLLEAGRLALVEALTGGITIARGIR